MIDYWTIKGHYMPTDALTLHHMAQRFYLTGSRFFGGWDEDADWDFFTHYTPDIENKLQMLGYKVSLTNDGYTDVGTVMVYQLNNIHIQLVYNPYHKMRAQKLLDSSGAILELKRTCRYNNIPKVQQQITAKPLWDMAFKATDPYWKVEITVMEEKLIRELNQETVDRFFALREKEKVSIPPETQQELHDYFDEHEEEICGDPAEKLPAALDG